MTFCGGWGVNLSDSSTIWRWRWEIVNFRAGHDSNLPSPPGRALFCEEWPAGRLSERSQWFFYTPCKVGWFDCRLGNKLPENDETSCNGSSLFLSDPIPGKATEFTALNSAHCDDQFSSNTNLDRNKKLSWKEKIERQKAKYIKYHLLPSDLYEGPCLIWDHIPLRHSIFGCAVGDKFPQSSKPYQRAMLSIKCWMLKCWGTIVTSLALQHGPWTCLYGCFQE